MLNIVRSEKGHALSVQGDINALVSSLIRCLANMGQCCCEP